MTDATSEAEQRFTVLCRRCDRPLIARRGWVGREVQCPHCSSLLRVPAESSDGRPVLAAGPNLSAKRCFNFACPRCDCVLEAHTGMSGQRGTCPTCAARFTIPFIRAGSGKPEKPVLIEGEAADPVPLHAYAASGCQAPRIVQRGDGDSVIECPRCNTHNPIDADTCASCGTPFTMEAAPTIGKLRRDSRATAALAFGVLALPLCFAIVPGLLASWLGLRSAMYAGSERRSTAGLVGLVLGLVSLIGGITFWYFKLS